MTKLSTYKPGQLPATIEELQTFVLIGKAKLKAHIAAIRAIDKMNVATGAKEAAIADAQDTAVIVLEAEGKLGEFLKSIPKEYTISSVDGTNRPQRKESLPSGITKKESHIAQTVSNNRETVQKVIEEALEKGTVPTTMEVIREVQKEKRKKVIESLPKVELPAGKFNIILADPPWKYDFSETTEREIENQYPTMELQDIKDLNIPCADDSALFLWATAPKLNEALEVMKAWGFQYKTHAVWDKEKIGMGYWFRGQHELLLVGTRGSFSPPAANKRVSSVIRQKREGHSQKPDAVYEIIEQMFPDARYLELFARNKREKWDSWGNQINE